MEQLTTPFTSLGISTASSQTRDFCFRVTSSAYLRSINLKVVRCFTDKEMRVDRMVYLMSEQLGEEMVMTTKLSEPLLIREIVTD